eukprot:TRINITY_DN12241_c0_g1_i11.p2 TRINITY_DN12241_c0_g1~~TRINITY_DN12241_c0_g1_i11.p2  ORF type:complete len:116 (+),score=17.94 TRINITY_DN12241_c0_g1_i11:1145-1492(+)
MLLPSVTCAGLGDQRYLALLALVNAFSSGPDRAHLDGPPFGLPDHVTEAMIEAHIYTSDFHFAMFDMIVAYDAINVIRCQCHEQPPDVVMVLHIMPSGHCRFCFCFWFDHLVRNL